MAYDRIRTPQDWMCEKADILRGSEDWLPPEPLVRSSLPATSFPIDALMSLGGVAKGIQTCTQAPLAMCAASVLSAANFTAASLFDVELWGGTIKPVNLFILTQGVSGERKSSVDRLAMTGIQRWQENLVAEQRISESDNGAEKARDNAQNPPYVINSDGTLQGIEIGLATEHPTQILSSDEGGRFLGGYAFQKEQFQSTISGLSNLWDGKPIVRRLKGNKKTNGELTVIDGARLCIHLLAQPVVIQPFMESGLLQGQGLAARFLFHAPKSTIGTRIETIESFRKPALSGAVAAFAEKLVALLSNSERRDPLTKNVDRQVLTLSDAAMQAYVTFQNGLECRQGEKGELRPYINLVNKFSEQAGRIAATLSVMQQEASISIDCMLAGIAIANYFLDETIRLAQSASVSAEQIAAENLANWLTGSDKRGSPRNGTALPELLRLGPNCCRKKNVRDQAVKTLCEAHWAKVQEGRLWINPALKNSGLLAI